MTIDSGTGLSHYKIISRIGAGGMGEVYLAQDTKLDRKVALKILPSDVASNNDRMERFIREAKFGALLWFKIDATEELIPEPPPDAVPATAVPVLS